MNRWHAGTVHASARVLCFLLLFFLSFGSLSKDPIAQDQEPGPNTTNDEYLSFGKYAMVIGIDQYSSSRISPLRYCEVDARNFATTLTTYCRYPSSHVVLLLGEKATYENIFAAVRSFSDKRLFRNGDTVVFYFAGHGVARDGRNYLVPWDGSASPELIESRNLDLEWVTQQLQASVFKKQVLLIDACRNRFTKDGRGEADSGLAEQQLIDENAKGMKILFGTEFGSVSWEDPALGHGLFTDALLQGLKGGAADDTGRIRVSDLEEYVLAFMADYSRQNPTRKQLPQSEGSGSSAILIAQLELDTQGNPIPVKATGSAADDDARRETIRKNLNNGGYTLDFRVMDFDGNEVSLTDLVSQNKLLWINFWGYD